MFTTPLFLPERIPPMSRTLLTTVLLCVVAAACAAAEPSDGSARASVLSAREAGILLGVGREYGLSEDALRLLLAIRIVENGGPGIEMGVAPDYPDHPARRYEGDFHSSLRVQARWAAGTIKKHYTGDLRAFAKRYCPPNWERWCEMARHWMGRTCS